MSLVSKWLPVFFQSTWFDHINIFLILLFGRSVFVVTSMAGTFLNMMDQQRHHILILAVSVSLFIVLCGFKVDLTIKDVAYIEGIVFTFYGIASHSVLIKKLREG